MTKHFVSIAHLILVTIPQGGTIFVLFLDEANEAQRDHTCVREYTHTHTRFRVRMI